MPSENQTVTDVLIVGGGMVGMGCALAMAQAGIHVTLLEAQPDLPKVDQIQFDNRTLVVNPASRIFWDELGVWSMIQNAASPIHQVHVSSQGHLGSVLFDKSEFNVDELGQVVEAKVLAKSLWQLVQKQENIAFMQPAKLVKFKVNETHVEAVAEVGSNSKAFKAQLMVAADGANSRIRKHLGLPAQIKSYERTAVITNIRTTLNHSRVAYERFTKTGPFALLPFRDRVGVVWSVETEQAETLMGHTDEQFKSALQKQLGNRLGSIKQLGLRQSYPLHQVKVEQQTHDRVVLLGNAAHGVSPVSAQGLNLAIRGVRRLKNQLQEARLNNLDLGSEAVLSDYQQASKPDQERILNYTDDLMTWFQIDEPVVNAVRGMGLMAIDANLTLKKRLFHLAGGMLE